MSEDKNEQKVVPGSIVPPVCCRCGKTPRGEMYWVIEGNKKICDPCQAKEIKCED